MIKKFAADSLAWIDKHWLEFFGLGAVALLLLIVLWPLIVINVPPGHVGVMWYRFFGGTATSPRSVMDEGVHLIFPWDKAYLYDARLQRIDESVTGLSVDGLKVSVNVSTRFVLRRDTVGFLHKAIGPDYAATMLRPQLRTLVLTYISENEASDLYSARRARVQDVISSKYQEGLSSITTNVPMNQAYVDLEDVLIEEIDLPPFVTAAIEEKEKVRHMSEAYDFRLQLEGKERDRKRIEAEGIRSFQEIVAPGITPSYLRWRGIEATLELAKSDNAKVVVIGNSSDGLPLILNMDTLEAEKAAGPLSGTGPGTPPRGGRGVKPGDPAVPAAGPAAAPGAPQPQGRPTLPAVPGPRSSGPGPVAPGTLDATVGGPPVAAAPRPQPGAETPPPAPPTAPAGPGQP